jgi:cytidylate kinase
MSIQIAIDGPSGAGKSTMAKMLAREKNFIYLDTGAMYRSFGLYAIKNGVDFEQWDPERDGRRLAAIIEDFTLEIRYIDGSQHVIVNGEDFTQRIRTPEVSLAASKVAVVPEVRLKLVEIQRQLAGHNNVVMDGRDIGSYVLPDATVKIFLTADAEDRARRRFLELQEKGDTSVTFEEVLEDMKFRDKNDSTRAFSPLTCAPDAIRLDTTGCTLEEAVAKIRKVVDERL